MSNISRSSLRPTGRGIAVAWVREVLTRILLVTSNPRLEERGSQITDNLGLIVIGIVAIVAIGGLISGLDTAIFNWVTGKLGITS